jgi:two-component system, chemotaxis family, CheB/CheR fusion protein
VAGENSRPNFFVVGIGASAGGLDALRSLFSTMTDTPGFACVVVVHLSPEHESHLVELLQPYTRMPVSQVTETTALQPNHVYVIPPNANLNSIDTHLRLSELEVRRGERAPIDHFLRTLAQTRGETAIGVILSGSGSDGALGIRQIKGHGGLTVAQDPGEAEYGSMPQSAIATGTVDRILPVAQIAAEISAYCATAVDATGLAADEVLADEEALLAEQILDEVRLSTSQDVAMYSRAALLRRVRGRMRLRHVDRLARYVELLRQDHEEARALCNELLRNITEFFRDPGLYETLDEVLDEILKRKLAQDGRVRIWSIGCSTGEEAYSLAILLIEKAARHEIAPKLQVFASELSAEALQRAREGIYPQGVAAWISKERLERFFVYESGHYHVRRELRDIVTFASHNLFRDPPYAHLDLIVCRSLLPNVRAEMRTAVMNLFYYALEPQGLLLAGPTDEIEIPESFAPVAATPCLRRRLDGPLRMLQLPPGLRPFQSYVGEQRSDSRLKTLPGDTGEIFRAAVERYAPPSVLVGPENEVVHFSPTAARYVRIPGGELTLDILDLVPEAIGLQLQGGLRAVRRQPRSWQSSPLALSVNARIHTLVVRIDPVEANGAPTGLLLITFDDTIGPPWAYEKAGTEKAAGSRALEEVARLQLELARARQQIGGASQSAQGESDDLRAALEELENAREEAQAVNEELISLNDENQYRIEKLAQLTNDLKHLLESTGLATLLVDTELKIVRFTPLASELFRIKSGDVNRPLTDLNHQLRCSDLIGDVQRVVRDLVTVEHEVESEDGRWFMVRVQPYQHPLRGLEGAVIVLVDISARRKAELALVEADRHKDEFLAVLAHELRNPLAPIRAGIEVLRGASDDRAVVQRVTAAMGRQTEQLVRLVDDLLEVARINSGKLTLRMGRVQVADVVRDAVAAVRPFIDSLKHELTIAVPEAPLTVEGDATRLVQVIGNLLHNAARYTPAGGRIAVTACQSEENALVAVRDNGQGISPHALPHLFEMFYQEGHSSQVKSAGLGIGLTLAKKLVELHRGTIHVESEGTNRGSTFSVRLPLARSSAEVGVTDPIGNGTGAMHKHRVLIVDDNADAAETLRLLMGLMGDDEVQTASTGAEALKVGARLHPNVVLLDLDMPGMDGYEVARRMRSETWGKEALLVALTGWGQDRHRHRTREAGFDRHMTKPADPTALRAVLNDLDMR